MNRFLIYALHHPASPHVYVGRSSSGLLRPKHHGMSANLKKNLPVTRWIKKLRASGEDYKIAVLEDVNNGDSLDEAERFFIAYFKSINMSLLNLTDGGQGARSGVAHTALHNANVSRAKKGKSLSLEMRARLSLAAKNRPKPTPESCLKRSQALKGKPKSPEHRAKLVANMRIVGMSLRGKPLSASHYEKVLAANRLRIGKPRSLDVRRKISMGLRTRKSENV